MEYQKVTNLLDNGSNQLSKFTTKNWVKINHKSRVGYNINSQTKFKNAMLLQKCNAITVMYTYLLKEQ